MPTAVRRDGAAVDPGGRTREPAGPVPELPEVEVVRRGLAAHLVGRRIAGSQVFSRPGRPPASRRCRPTSRPSSPVAQVAEIRRRGKYLWWALDDGDAVIAHLGMSGQFRVGAAGAVTGAGHEDPGDAIRHPHLRIRFPSTTADRTSTSSTSGPSAGWRSRRAAPSCRPRSRTSPGIRSTRNSRLDAGGRRDPAQAHRDQARPARPDAWCPGSATSTPTRRSGGPGCTTRGRPRGLTRPAVRAVLTAATEVMTAGAGRRRNLVRRVVRQRQRRVRLLRPIAERVRPAGPAVPAVRHADPPRRVHEPFVVLLPALPASAPERRPHELTSGGIAGRSVAGACHRRASRPDDRPGRHPGAPSRSTRRCGC